MKKVFKTIIVFCLLISLTLPYSMAFAAAEDDTVEWQDVELTDEEFTSILNENPQNGVSTYASGLITGKGIALSKNGALLYIIGYTNCVSSVKTCGFKSVVIQRRTSNGNWTEYKTYTDLIEEGTSYQLSKSIIALGEYQYRAICVHYAKKNFLSVQKIDNESNILIDY